MGGTYSIQIFFCLSGLLYDTKRYILLQVSGDRREYTGCNRNEQMLYRKKNSAFRINVSGRGLVVRVEYADTKVDTMMTHRKQIINVAT